MGRYTKRVYTDEFKIKAIRMVMPPNHMTVEDAAKELGMPYATLHDWRRRAIMDITDEDKLTKLERVKKIEKGLREAARERAEQKPTPTIEKLSKIERVMFFIGMGLDLALTAWVLILLLR